MVEIRVDVARNRLYLRHTGVLEESEVERLRDETLRAIEQLRPGFDIVVNLVNAGPLGPEAQRALQHLMSEAHARGLRREVRIVGRSVEPTLHFERVSKHMGVTAFLAFSEEEAERLLESDRS